MRDLLHSMAPGASFLLCSSQSEAYCAYHPFQQLIERCLRLFACAFASFQLRPTEQHLIVPTLPGVLTRPAQDRLATILYRRFEALASRNGTLKASHET